MSTLNETEEYDSCGMEELCAQETSRKRTTRLYDSADDDENTQMQQRRVKRRICTGDNENSGDESGDESGDDGDESGDESNDESTDESADDSDDNNSGVEYTLETFRRIAPLLPEIDMEISEVDLQTAAQEVTDYWVMQARPKLTIKKAYKMYGLTESPLAMDEIDKRYDEELNPVIELYRRIMKLGLDEDDIDSIVRERLHRVLRIIKETRCLLQTHQSTCNLLDPQLCDEQVADIWAMTSEMEKELTKKQRVVLHLLECAAKRRYRKKAGDVYEEKIIEKNGETYHTHAWVKKQSMSEFVHHHIRKEQTFEIWKCFFEINETVLVEYLNKSLDRELPFLECDRHAFSFTNGIYFVVSNTFQRYDDCQNAIAGSVVTAKFIDIPFNEKLLAAIHATPHVTFRDVKTPWLDKIFSDQDIPTEEYENDTLVRDGMHIGESSVCEFSNTRLKHMHFSVYDWFIVFLGRLLYSVNERDTWQVILFLKGVAGSGKSTLGKVAEMFYNKEDVSILPNNIQKVFGLENVFQTLLFLCLEVKNDFGLDQGDFQSMVSGEKMSIAIKNKQSECIDWTTPGMLMGNELPSWTNNSGSIGRRVVIGAFNTPITQSDPHMLDHLRNELANILLKANLAYIHATHQFGRSDIWDVLPSYFKEQRRLLRADTHTLDHFLQNGENVIVHPTGVIKMDTFKNAFRQHVRDMGKPYRWGPDFYMTTFYEYNIKIDKTNHRDANNNPLWYLKGVSIGTCYDNIQTGMGSGQM